MKPDSKGRKRSVYDLMSAMHKEFRRNDTKRALAFAGELVETVGEHRVKNYTYNAILEETRNAHLWRQGLNTYSWQEMVARLAASKKKWECEIRRRLFDIKVDSFIRAQELGAFSSSRIITEVIASFDSVDGFYTSLFRVFIAKNKEQKEMLRNALKERVVKELKDLPAWMGKIDDRKLGIYELMMVGEALCGSWSGECNEIREYKIENLAEDVSVLKLRDYVFDNHTWTGKARMKKAWDRIQPGLAMPKGLDLRWSGMVISLCWRTKAFEQYGQGYVGKKWEDVDINPELWRRVKIYDRWWYSKFYELVEGK